MLKRTTAALFLASLALPSARGADVKPNIVFIMADDLGNADLGYRGGEIRTPNIDKLATTGVRCESFYGMPVCTPARAALMTGRYPIRHGLQTLVIFPSHGYGLPTDERTLPQALKAAGYQTYMVDIMPTLLALAGGKGAEDHPFDGKDIWSTLAEGKPSPHEKILFNVEAIRGAIRKGNWKLVRMATFPGKTELYNLADDPEEKHNVADQHPEIVSELNARLIDYARQMKPSEWIKAQPSFLGAQSATLFDPDFDIEDGGLPHEKPHLPTP